MADENQDLEIFMLGCHGLKRFDNPFDIRLPTSELQLFEVSCPRDVKSYVGMSWKTS